MRLDEFKIDKPKASDTMGITRDKMPQVKSDDYEDYKKYLKDNGITLRPQIVDAKDLKPMQKEFSDQGVEKQLKRNKEKGAGINPKPLLASSDSYIIDGHHRWLAALNSGHKVSILRANADGNKLLSLTLKYPRVYFKDIYTENEEMDVIAKAEQFAQQAHKDHQRKYTGDPYYVHLDEVRNIVKQAGGTVEQQAAALLHDTVEDTNTTPMDITREFGPKIAKLVVELTDVSKPEDGNRKTRKAIDRDKLAGVSAEAQTIKYADLISNGKDIGQNDPKFAKVYHAEKADLLRVMTKGNQNLRKQAIALLPDELKSVVGEGYKDTLKKAGYDVDARHDDWKKKAKADSKRSKDAEDDLKAFRKKHNIKEETPFGVLSRKASRLIHKKAYVNMAKMMHKILTRKYKETGGKLRHSLGYYAQMLAMQTNNRINYRELEQEYLDLFGNAMFEGWSDKYKKSINCSNPKGFSQKAHCAGKKKKESINEEALNIKSIITPAIRKLDKVFKDNQHEVRIVGGAVRDIALGKSPKDIDFATDATPTEMMTMLDKAGIKHKPTGLEHGTLTAIIDKEPFEITTLRADKETDGRKADVEFVRSWEEDAKRRDLTYNAMSMDIDGKIYDYNGGMDDLQDKVSKFVGDPAERIREDYLRILRYFRFQAKLDSPKWDENTIKAISDNAGGLRQISVERVWQEMSKLLISTNAQEALTWMVKTGVAKVIGLDNIDPAKVGQSAGPIIALAKLLDSSDIASEWKMSNEEKNMLDFLIMHKNDNIDIKKAQDLVVKGIDKGHLLAWANMHGKKDVYMAMVKFEAPEFPVNGKDLLAMGYRAGPQLGKMLNDLQDKWMKSGYKLDKEELLKKVPVQESIVIEAVARFMTGHGITYKGKKYDEMEVEVVAVDNEKRQYQVMILSPEELLGTNVMMSARFMHRGPWVKTKIPDYMGAIEKGLDEGRRSRQKTITVYHGTTSKYLNSIKKQGLLPDRPNDGFGTLGTGDYSKPSLGGVYTTIDKETAEGAALEVAQIHGGDPILVHIQLVIGSGGEDEDNLEFVERSYTKGKWLSASEYAEKLGTKYNLPKGDWKKLEQLHQLIKSIAIEELKDEEDSTSWEGQQDSPQRAIEEIINDPRYMKLAGQILSKMRVTKHNMGKYQNMRVTRPIGFKGKNKIVKIEKVALDESNLDEDFEKLLEDETPDVYVDMDGVLVDFFNEWARLVGVKSYRDISKRDIPKALKKIVDTPNFWEDLPTLSGYKELLQTIKAVKGKYKILSSPLANDPNVDPGKREWVRKHLGFFRPEKVIIDHNKSKYAKKPDGSPNLLIDDFGKNVNAWQSAGGIAIKHHTTTTGNTVDAIKKVFSKTVNEAGGVGRVVPGINTTVDVGPNEIVKQAKKFGNDVNKDGFPKKLLRTKKK